MNKVQVAIVEKAIEYMKDIMIDDNSGHDYFHSLRVYNMAMRIADSYEVDNYIVALAAILHDLDDEKLRKDSHLAEAFLQANKVSESDKILDIIKTISFREHKAGIAVASLEGKIVQDADRLDALGAIGIARCFAYSGHSGKPIYKNDKDDDSAIAHFYQKLLLLPNLINTDIAKTIAFERVDYLNEYLNRFYSEWEGEL